MSNIVSLSSFRDEFSNPTYSAKIAQMDRLELVNEVVNFNEERYMNGGLNKDLIVKGLILFKNMAENSATSNFREFARSYHKHLELEMQVLRNKYV